MNGNLESYKVFYYVAKQGGITAAAKKLCITQPAVSQAIHQLEERVGTTLFLRTAKGVRLTREGEVLYAYVKDGYETIERGEEHLQKMLHMDRGEVRIGASDMTLRFYLLPFLEEYHRRYPNIKVNVTNAPTPETIAHLHAGRIDFGIVSTPLPPVGRAKVTPVREIEDIFVVGRKFWELRNKLLTYPQLNEFPLICLENNTSTRRSLDEFLMDNEVVIKPEFELATSDIIVQFALRNMGVACVVKDFAQEYITNGELIELHFDKALPKREICIMQSEDIPMAIAAKRLWDLLMT